MVDRGGLRGFFAASVSKFGGFNPAFEIPRHESSCPAVDPFVLEVFSRFRSDSRRLVDEHRVVQERSNLSPWYVDERGAPTQLPSAAV